MNKKNKRFLIALLRFHGDIVLTTPMINEIKRNFPNAEIDYLVYRGTGSILESDSRVNKILEAESSSKSNLIKRVLKEIQLLRKLITTNYDYGIFLTTQWRMALMARCLVNAKTAGVDDIKRRKASWVNSFTTIFNGSENKHIVERNLKSLEQLGLKINFKDITLKLSIPKAAEDSVKELNRSYLIGNNYCVFHPVSRRKVKLWTKEYFAELIDYYSGLGLKVVVTSGPEKKELSYLNDIESLTESKPINLGGQTSLIELAELIKGANFFVALDSVASHIGAAVGTKGVTLFGPSKPENWRPWSKNISIISRNKNEEYCSLHGHLEGKSKQCLCYISPKKVIKELERLNS